MWIDGVSKVFWSEVQFQETAFKNMGKRGTESTIQ